MSRRLDAADRRSMAGRKVGVAKDSASESLGWNGKVGWMKGRREGCQGGLASVGVRDTDAIRFSPQMSGFVSVGPPS